MGADPHPPPTPARDPRATAAQAQRDRIHAAVIGLVAEQGYGATTVDHIARRAGVSKATLYAHFEGREQCFWSALDDSAAEMVSTVELGFAEGGPTWEARVRGGLAALLEFLDTHRHFAHVLFIEALATGAEGLARRDLMLQSLRRLFDHHRQPDLAQRGLSRPEVRAAAAVDAIAGALFSLMLAGETDGLPDRLDDFVWAALLPFAAEHP